MNYNVKIIKLKWLSVLLVLIKSMEFRYHKPNYTVDFIEKVMPHWFKKKKKTSSFDFLPQSLTLAPTLHTLWCLRLTLCAALFNINRLISNEIIHMKRTLIVFPRPAFQDSIAQKAKSWNVVGKRTVSVSGYLLGGVKSLESENCACFTLQLVPLLSHHQNKYQGLRQVW